MALFNKILVANRGEIACRILRTANRLGIKTVAVFSEVDRDALHVKMADEAFLIGPAPSKDSYLNIENIIQVALKAQVDAIHPGYGFLSENYHFAEACQQNNICFVGPSSSVINLMANKNLAKDVLEEHGVPVLPGFYDQEQNVERLLAAANEIGFPVVLKAIAGGGGKGLRLVHDAKEFEHAYLSVKREAKAFFNDEKVLVEKYLSQARHIEVQILADNLGEIIPLFTRDCSIQRRHQKIVEEAPAPLISANLQNKMMQAAVKAAQAIQYTNAGTLEFLVENDNFYFMEMNTRLQVEHPVTEMITKLDLVEWQLRIAALESLPKKEFLYHGHAIEVRLNAEDPDKDFLPSSGYLHCFEFPGNDEHVRIDKGYQTNDFVNIYYDSLLAKIIVWDKNRSAAIQRLQKVLGHTYVFGIKTNLALLKNILENDNFKLGQINTHFLQQEKFKVDTVFPPKVFAICSLFLMLYTKQQKPEHSLDSNSPWLDRDGWQLFFESELQFHLIYKKQNVTTSIKKQGENYLITIGDDKIVCSLTYFTSLQKNIYELGLILNTEYLKSKLFYNDYHLEIFVNAEYYQVEIETENNLTHENIHDEQLRAPMPGTLVALHVNQGQKVIKGDKLLVIEAMKMEHTLYAPKDGTIKECYYQIGDLIKEGAELIEFER